MAVTDFDRIISRRDTSSLKWDEKTLIARYGRSDVLPFWVADMDFAAPEEVVRALQQRVSHGIFGYSLQQDAYHQGVIDWMDNRFGWAVRKEWIQYVPGVVPAIRHMIRAFCLPGDKVLVQTPVYYPFFQSVEQNGCHIVENRLVREGSRYRMDFDDLERKAADPRVKLMLLCSPHNPTATVWSREDLLRVGEICRRHHVLVVSDEIHNDIVFPPNPHHVFSALSEELMEISVVCTAPSKTFNLAGLASSQIFIPNPRIRERFDQVSESSGIESKNPLSIAAVEAAYRYGQPWLEDLLEYLKGNANAMAAFFRDHMPQAVMMEQQATYLAWIDMSAYGLPEIERYFAAEAGIGIYDGIRFGEAGRGYIRICFASPRSVLMQALEAMKAALDRR